MAKSPNVNIDFKVLQDKLRSQFSDLDPNDPSLWPALPRNLLLVGVDDADVVEDLLDEFDR